MAVVWPECRHPIAQLGPWAVAHQVVLSVGWAHWEMVKAGPVAGCWQLEASLLLQWHALLLQKPRLPTLGGQVVC